MKRKEWADDFLKLYKENSKHPYIIRILALAKIQEGWALVHVARMVNKSQPTIREWIRRYEGGGLEHLFRIEKGRGPKARLASTAQVKEAIQDLNNKRNGGRNTAKDIQRMIKETFNVELSQRGVYHLLDRLKFSWITARSIHPQAKQEEQEKFKKTFTVRVRKVLPKGVHMKKIDIWFEDEMRVGQQGSLTRIWAEKGTRPRVVRQKQFISEYIFGAVCPVNRHAVGLVLPVNTGACLQLLLNEISQETKPGRIAVTVLDGAGSHRNQALAIPSNVCLLLLPPYSPELNPVEQIWAYLRDQFLSNRVFESLEHIIDACCEAWNAFANNKSLIASLTTRTWANI